jgi:NADPH-dependent ferric siderophore reductase
MARTRRPQRLGLGRPAVDALNRAFPDSLLLVGRVLGGRPSATAARAVGVDALGLDLSVRDRAGEHAVRVEFDGPLTSAQEVGRAVLGLVEEARRRSGEPGETSGERELARLRAVRTFSTRVTGVADVHRYLRRITLDGSDLAAFTPLGPDTFVYVMPSTDSAPVDWSAWPPLTGRPAGAYYTVRSWRPAVGQLELLVVTHDEPGVVSSWAGRAAPGDRVALWGPRDGFEPPADTAWYLLVADDTGLPAVAAIVSQLRPGARAVVVAEVDDAETQQALPERDGVEVRWVHRRGRPAGTVPELLADAVRARPLPTGPGYVWGGAERTAITTVRSHVAALGVPPERRSLVAYWHAGRQR